MSTIIGIDTSGPVLSVAVLRNGKIEYVSAQNTGLTHSETLMPALDTALECCKIRCSDADCFAVVAGPGSFTGVRIGVCAAKGLAHAVNKPCMRVNALEALAMNFAHFDGLVCPILDARRHQVYCACFDVSSGLPKRILEDDACDLDVFLEKLPRDRRLLFLGDGLKTYAPELQRRLPGAIIAPENLSQLRADALCLLAEAYPEQWMDGKGLTPIYLRKPQAERERDRKQKEKANGAD